jgi:hypothetical protein
MLYLLPSVNLGLMIRKVGNKKPIALPIFFIIGRASGTSLKPGEKNAM